MKKMLILSLVTMSSGLLFAMQEKAMGPSIGSMPQPAPLNVSSETYTTSDGGQIERKIEGSQVHYIKRTAQAVDFAKTVAQYAAQKKPLPLMPMPGSKHTLFCSKDTSSNIYSCRGGSVYSTMTDSDIKALFDQTEAEFEAAKAAASAAAPAATEAATAATR